MVEDKRLEKVIFAFILLVIGFVVLISIYGQTAGDVADSATVASDSVVTTGNSFTETFTALIANTSTVVEAPIFSITLIANTSDSSDTIPLDNVTINRDTGQITWNLDGNEGFSNTLVDVTYISGSTNNLPLRNLFTPSGVVMIIFVAGILLGIIGFVLIKGKSIKFN